MYQRVPFFIGFAFLLFPCSGFGLTIEAGAESSGTIPNFSHSSSDPNPLTIPIRLYNESPSTESVALWQISLSVFPAMDANGAVEMVGIHNPPVQYFESTGPTTSPPGILPSAQAVIADFDIPPPPGFPGKTILPDERRGLVEIDFASPNNAIGTFYLVLGGFSPIVGSSWIGPTPQPNPFANAPSSSLPGEIVLAEIVFVPEPIGLIGVLSCVLLVLMSRYPISQ